MAPAGTPECQTMFDELGALPARAPFTYAVRRMMVDAYCLQHADRYCASAKSLAAHLTGLLAAFEHGSHPSVLEAQRRWLDGRRPLEKPALPPRRTARTIAEVYHAADDAARAEVVERWARAVWDDFAPLHPVARDWTRSALETR
jgi:hypothetical protein